MRTLAATFLQVGLNKLDEHDVLLCFQSKIRREKITTAPPQGLFLEKVIY
ncbi:MAG: hypothetical protein LBS71_00065 [Puniceicoccales bacterium]|nr:hypothetical protein [Puniceicoccales bacterium]